jgi:hypothetical protein
MAEDPARRSGSHSFIFGNKSDGKRLIFGLLSLCKATGVNQRKSIHGIAHFEINLFLLTADSPFITKQAYFINLHVNDVYPVYVAR